MAIVPPTVATDSVQGSCPHIRPCGLAAAFTAASVAPAPASAMRSAGRTHTSAMRRRSSTTAGVADAAPPIRPLPPPSGITATRCRLASRSTACTSDVQRGSTTQRGRPGAVPAGSLEGCSASHAITANSASSVRTRDGPNRVARASSTLPGRVDSSEFAMGIRFLTGCGH